MRLEKFVKKNDSDFFATTTCKMINRPGLIRKLGCQGLTVSNIALLTSIHALI